MLFSKYTSSLRRFHKVDLTSKARLVLVLRERQSFAPFDDVIRFGAYELGLLDDACRALKLPCREDADWRFTRPRQLTPDESRRLEKSPRDVYATDVMPRAQKNYERMAMGNGGLPIPPLDTTLASEVAFAILDDLYVKCSLLALRQGSEANRSNHTTIVPAQGHRHFEDAGRYDGESLLDDTVETAALAALLFDGPVSQTMIDDWGHDFGDDPPPMPLDVPSRLAESLRMTFRSASHDLRLLLGEASEELGGLAVDVWRAKGVLSGSDRTCASLLSPPWWLRPTYRLPNLYDRIDMEAMRVLEPFDHLGNPRGAEEGDVERLAFDPNSARGLAAVCGMVLARATLSDCPSYAGRRKSARGEPIDLASLAELHRRLLCIAGLL